MQQLNFLVNMYNHNKIGQTSLEDVVGIMGHQIRALGHTIIWDPGNEKFITGPYAWNIVVEGFTMPAVEVMAKGHREGARFLILATEEPHEKGFNQGTQRDMVLRQQVFPEAAKYCEGIIHLVPGQHVTDWYGQFAPAVQAELGYAPTLVRNTNPEPEWDFGFYGSVTGRRYGILKRLAKRNGSEKSVKAIGDFKTQNERDVQMQRCKVIVQIRKFNSMGLVSSSRCNTALNLYRPIVAEPHLLSYPWDQIVRFAKTEDSFYDEAILTRCAWRGVHAAQFEKFKRLLTPEFCIGQALDKLGVTGRNQVPLRLVS